MYVTNNACDIVTPSMNSHPVKSLRLQIVLSLVNTIGEETLRIKHMQLNTITCDSWKKKRVTPFQVLPAS